MLHLVNHALGQVHDVPPLGPHPRALRHRRSAPGLGPAPDHAGHRVDVRGGHAGPGGAAALRPLPLEARAAAGRLRDRPRLADGARAGVPRGGVHRADRPSQSHAERGAAGGRGDRGRAAAGRSCRWRSACSRSPCWASSSRSRSRPCSTASSRSRADDRSGRAAARAWRGGWPARSPMSVSSAAASCTAASRRATRGGCAEALRTEHGAELRLMVADDRRVDAGRFDVHLSLRASDRELVRARDAVAGRGGPGVRLARHALHHPASLFEREIHDLFGIVRGGPPRSAAAWSGTSSGPRTTTRSARTRRPARFRRTTAGPSRSAEVEGEGIFEITVGPVHAGHHRAGPLPLQRRWARPSST